MTAAKHAESASGWSALASLLCAAVLVLGHANVPAMPLKRGRPPGNVKLENAGIKAGTGDDMWTCYTCPVYLGSLSAYKHAREIHGIECTDEIATLDLAARRQRVDWGAEADSQGAEGLHGLASDCEDGQSPPPPPPPPDAIPEPGPEGSGGAAAAAAEPLQCDTLQVLARRLDMTDAAMTGALENCTHPST